MGYVDTDNTTATWMSSSDSLNLDICSEITWAGLYWSARIESSTTNYAFRNQVKLRKSIILQEIPGIRAPAPWSWRWRTWTTAAAGSCRQRRALARPAPGPGKSYFESWKSPDFPGFLGFPGFSLRFCVRLLKGNWGPAEVLGRSWGGPREVPGGPRRSLGGPNPNQIQIHIKPKSP